MASNVRDFLNSGKGRALSVLILVVAVVAVGFTVRTPFGSSAAARVADERTFLCVETGKTFTRDVERGTRMPLKSPYTGRETGYEVDETCSWTADGKVAPQPTYIVMNATLGKPGPTFCPTCGRLVVSGNPPAEEGRKPPPTKAEVVARNGSASK